MQAECWDLHNELLFCFIIEKGMHVDNSTGIITASRERIVLPEPNAYAIRQHQRRR